MRSSSKLPAIFSTAGRALRKPRSEHRCFWCERAGSSEESASSLTLPLALRHVLHFFLLGAARDSGCPLSLGGRFLAGRALYFLALCSICDRLGVHSF